ncbi:hypothetical protein ES332_D05G317100v1 [Gossypium tomentosum]|uniref:RNase H type-1 domain-containing protein n=1 Tax=Gossypium tomentosum TaxID=34277 RepID=A0A5D2L2H7_GOSTO|nr:hypothetical protein ES332_D05G317100v1 [Gossypium tomentosum]
MSWRFPPRGWLKFNVCGVVFEAKVGGGGVFRDEDGVARALFSGPSEAKDAKLAELKSIGVALELYEDKSGKVKLFFFAEIERRSYLSFGKVEHMGNEMAFALAIAGVMHSDTFKA